MSNKGVTIIIQQHIFWFEISVDDSLLVEVLQALDDLSDVETGSGLLKPWVVLIHQVNVIPSGNRQQVSFSIPLCIKGVSSAYF